MSRSPSPDADWRAELLRLGPAALVGLVGAEFVLLRVLNRMSGAFPAWARGDVAQGIVLAGAVAYNGAFVLSIALMVLVAERLWRARSDVALAFLAWIPVLLAVQVLGGESPAALALAGVLAGLVMTVVVAQGIRSILPARSTWSERLLGGPWARALFLLAVLAAFLTGLYLHAGDALANAGLSLPGRPEAYAAGEALAVAGALLAPIAFWRRPGPRNLVLPVLAVVVLAGWYLARPDLLPLVAYWSLGFRLDLPIAVYLAAAAAYVFAISNRWAEGPTARTAFYGLLLLGLVGRQMGDFYTVQLAILAVTWLGLGGGLDASVSAAPPVVSTDAAARADNSAGAPR